jgi:spermine/spermidine synthase
LNWTSSAALDRRVARLAEPVLPPVDVLARPAVRLFLTSALVLFVELILIRWIPANVVYLGFFRNFLLMASFLGIGAGVLFGRDPRRIPLSPFAIVLFAVVAVVGTLTLRANIGLNGEVAFGITNNGRADPGFLVLALIVMLASIIMAAVALPLGRLLTSMPPLTAYAFDVVGSMTGIAAFAALSGLATPPAVWFLVVALLSGVLALGTGVTRWSLVSGAFLVATALVTIVQSSPGSTWSAYYRIDYIAEGNLRGISVNGIPHQGMWPLSNPARPHIYGQIYDWFPDRTFDNVLIVGAGTGTDVASALAHGAKHVDAVEIDSTIQQIGIREHPDRPYDDPRVTRWIDDGRSFLRQSTDRYDLVVFALPDSLTLVSTTASIRLESFLFTNEAFASVKDHLAKGGAFVLYNYYRETWLVQKIGHMLQHTFGGSPLIRLSGTGLASSAVLAAGPAVTELNGGPPPGDAVDPLDLSAAPGPATDDWPFLYLLAPSLPSHYFVALGLILAWAVILIGRAARRSGTPLRKFSPHFFVLGVAFLLLETRSIVTFSLLFGSTWLVNALVFFAVLASILLAILVASRFAIRRSWWLYAALLGSIGIAYLLPPASLLIEPPWLRYVVAGALAFAPVFFANLVFSYSFRDTRTADTAFASNLFGAMVGGAIEYLALITGYQALLLIVAGLYITAYVLAERVRLLADTDLMPAEHAASSVEAPASI